MINILSVSYDNFIRPADNQDFQDKIKKINSLDRTTNKLHGFGYNIKVITNYIEILKSKYEGPDKNGKQKYIRGTLNERLGKEMNFDVVIGNPPYQENNSTNGRQSKPIYDKFIETGIVMTSRLLVFITNNTFLTNDSKKELRDKMINAGLKCLYNYPLSGDIFKGVGVSACIFIIDKHNNADFRYKRFENNKEINSYSTKLKNGDIIAESKYEISIPQKVHSNNHLGNIVLGDKVFGIASNGRIGFTGQGGFVDIQLIETERSVKILNKINGEASIGFIDREDIPKGTEYIDKYCVICPREISKSSLKSFDKGEILKSGYICTENWSVMGIFDSEENAKNYIKYLETKFNKFITYVFCSTGMTKLTKIVMSHVPLQDFTSNSDIDWSKSIPEIDQQLYKKYSLSQEEIDYIEKTIKPMK